MQRLTRTASIGAVAGLALALSITGATRIQVAWADPPGGFEHGHGHDKDDEHGRRADRDEHGRDDHGRGGERAEHGRHFHDHDRVAVHDYFVREGHDGRCPPGLAKRGDDCVPPGHDRRWAVGAPLPPDVVAYPLPAELTVQLTPPPIGYRYVRVASDILMVAAGTGMVAEAIQDLGR
jgi:Ni/Co efflux regulator RcnB